MISAVFNSIYIFTFIFLQSNQINQATKRDHLRKRADTGEFFFTTIKRRELNPAFLGYERVENCPIPQESNAARVSANLYLAIPVADFHI